MKGRHDRGGIECLSPSDIEQVFEDEDHDEDNGAHPSRAERIAVVKAWRTNTNRELNHGFHCSDGTIIDYNPRGRRGKAVGTLWRPWRGRRAGAASRGRDLESGRAASRATAGEEDGSRERT